MILHCGMTKVCTKSNKQQHECFHLSRQWVASHIFLGKTAAIQHIQTAEREKEQKQSRPEIVRVLWITAGDDAPLILSQGWETDF
jgi:hypothetical protein